MKIMHVRFGVISPTRDHGILHLTCSENELLVLYGIMGQQGVWLSELHMPTWLSEDDVQWSSNVKSIDEPDKIYSMFRIEHVQEVKTIEHDAVLSPDVMKYHHGISPDH